MKSGNLKNRIFAAAITSAILLSSAICALAATPAPAATTRPRPGTTATETTSSSDSSSNSSSSSSSSNDSDDEDEDESSSDSEKSSTAAPKSTASSEENKQTVNTVVTTVAPATTEKAVSEKKYTTKGGAFGWFLLSLIVNSLLSFAIGNRFYKMAKKDTHVTSEIRALRRDIEEKFAANIGGFSEQEKDITNSNADYSIDPDGIKANTASSEETEESAEEVFRRWESQLAAQRAEKRAQIRASVTPRSKQSTQSFVETDEDKEDVRGRRSYQPRREAEPVEEDTDDEWIDDEDAEESTLSAIKNKAKDLITDIFPFRED